MKKFSIKKLLIIGIMFLLSFIMLYPFILMLITSLKTMDEISASSFVFIPKKIMIENYIEAMQRGKWGLYFFNTFYVSIVSVLVSLTINSTAGYAFSRLNFRGRDVLFIISLVGMMIPQQAIMIPSFIIMRKFPFMGGNDFFGNGGLGLVNTYLGLMFPYLAGPFGVFLFRQFFMNFPKSLDDAAKIDGLSRLKAFIYIYIPLSKPVFATLAVLKLNQVWNEYAWPLIITTEDSMKTVQLALSLFYGEYEIKWHLLMAATTLITLPTILLFFIAQKYYVEGIVTTGIKG